MGYKLKNIKSSPLKGLDTLTVTSSFGARSFYNNKTKKQQTDFHSGIDLIGGSIIVTPAKGKVISSQTNVKGYSQTFSRGNYVIIDHGNNIQTAYYHIKYGTLKVKVGDIVEAGTEIGITGATGNATGVHLHYGVRVNGSWVDPTDYLLGKKTLTEASKNEEITYTIKQGDTLSGIAIKFNTTVDELVKLNNIKNRNLIITGNILKIKGKIEPSEMTHKTYTVKKGDNLSIIAKKYNTTWQKIYSLNKETIGSNPNIIRPGQVLKIE